MLKFDWDEIKNKSNRSKHGIWFEEARTVFDDDQARVFGGSGHSADEERFIIVGFSSAARLLVVVHCYRRANSVIRLISARKATRKEPRFYEKGL